MLWGRWIVPGQKFDENLLREIKEETGLSVKIGRPFYVGEWRPKVGNENWQIVGTFFKCKATSSKVKLSPDHDSFGWINPRDYKKFNLIPAFEASGKYLMLFYQFKSWEFFAVNFDIFHKH